MGVLSPPFSSRFRKIRHNRRLVLLIASFFLATTILYSRPSARLEANLVLPNSASASIPKPPPEPVPLEGPPVVINSLTSPPPHPPLASWTPVPQQRKSHEDSTGTKNTSSLATAYNPDVSRPWLIGINSAVTDFARRTTIRETWLSLYRDHVPFHYVFFVANPGAQATSTTKATGWAERIAAENATHGDIVVLDNIPDDDFTAHTIQPLEFFSWVRRHRAHVGYRFVTKVEPDVFLNAAGLWNRYIGQWLDDEYAQNTLLGQRIVSQRAGGGENGRDLEIVHTHSMAYTLGWELMDRVGALYEATTVHGTRLTEREDVAPALLLTLAHDRYRVVSLTLTESFNYWDADCRGDGTPWVRRASQVEWAWHALRPASLVVSNLKTERIYRKVSSWFDKDGVRTMTPVRGWMGERVALWMQFIDLFWQLGIVGGSGNANDWENPHAPSEVPEVQPWQSPWKVREINGDVEIDSLSCNAWKWCRGY